MTSLPELQGTRFEVTFPRARCRPDEATRRSPPTGRAGPGSDLDDDRQDHRPAAQPVIDERRKVVVQLLLEQIDLVDAVFVGARQRALDRVTDLLTQALGLLDERHASEDHLGVGDGRALRL